MKMYVLVILKTGPLGENGNKYRGIFILDVRSIEQAQALIKRDPTVENGMFEAELYLW